MYANATEALEGLRHKRTGAVLPTKNVANNTKLVYFADELVGLKLHATIIALYRTDGVSIDVRGEYSPTGEGWFTNVTWNRIEQFTPARCYRRDGLQFVNDRLYAHGLHISSDGSCTNAIEPVVEDAVRRILRTYPSKLRRYAVKVANAWAEWQDVGDCCTNTMLATDEDRGHYLSHIERGEVVVPQIFTNYVAEARNTNLYGDAMLAYASKRMREALDRSFIRLAVKRVEPDFPYPQRERTRR
jgi:hypothetical protein